PLHKLKQQRGLAHAWLGNERQETAASFDAIEQRGQCFAVRRAEVEETWVRRNAERLFTKLIEFQKHSLHLSFFGIAASTGRFRRSCNSSGVRNDGSK